MPVRTYQDAVEHLTDHFDVDRAFRLQRNVRRAVEEAYRDLPQQGFWACFRRRAIINTVASQTTGSITYCVTPDHEILTKDGWKRFYDLSVGQEVMSYDHERGEMRWSPLRAVHVFRHSGKLLVTAIRGRTILACTANHRIPVFSERGRSHRRVREWTTAEHLRANDTVPCIAPCMHDGNPGCGLGVRLAAILGWSVTDGHGLLDYHARHKSSQHQSRISQSPTHNPSYCDEIESLTGMTGKVYGSSTCKSIGVKAADRREIRSLIQRTTDLPAFVAKMNFEEATAFKSACEKADGTKTAGGEIVFEQWNQKNEPVAEAYQIACVLVGKGCNKRSSIYRGKQHHKVITRSTTETYLRRASRWTDYEGTVWCPQVDSGAWLMRCNGHVMITGNSHSSRTVTLASTTFPTTAAKYRIIIANVHYDIESYTDTTHVVLPIASNPGADVAAGTTYTLYRNEYPLPATFRRALGLVDVSCGRPIPIITDAQEHSFQQLGSMGTPGTPVFAAIRNTGEIVGGLSLVFNCPPSAANGYDLQFDAIPRPFVLSEKYSVGTVSVSSGATAVTGSGTTFPSNCAGCILRLSVNAADEPTGPFGAQIDGVDVDNLYSFQTAVYSRDSATALTLLDAADQAYSSVKYSISDPVDIEDNAMYDAFLRLAEYKYARLARMDAKVVNQYEMDARQAVVMAKENDKRTIGSQFPYIVDYLPGSVTNGDD